MRERKIVKIEEIHQTKGYEYMVVKKDVEGNWNSIGKHYSKKGIDGLLKYNKKNFYTKDDAVSYEVAPKIVQEIKKFRHFIND
jgi:hypothetical protein